MVRVFEKPDQETRRLKIAIQGAVQGVGFRPFVYRLAVEMRLRGWVSNTPQGVCIEVEGEHAILHAFVERILLDRPPLSSIHTCETSLHEPEGYTGFEIRESSMYGRTTAFVLPDIATCPDCLREIFDVRDRRYLYPFTNCTNCGPRFTIIQSLPYDRKNTTMKSFTMCEQCTREYHDPSDRRFHAQPNACPLCGPHAELWDKDGAWLSSHTDAIMDAAQAIVDGGIVAVKGLGGYMLMCDARRDGVIEKLRMRKHREEKPFALMFPSLEHVEQECTVSALERRMLMSVQAPIVLVKARRHLSSVISSGVAPGNPWLGVILPFTPLHHVLLSLLHFPVVATSGNISDEPICTHEDIVVKKMHGIADRFLVHDRVIERYCDDSIVSVVHGRELMVRRARGYAPLPIHIPMTMEHPMLAVGGQQKNTIAIGKDDTIVVSQHIGDLSTAEARASLRKTIADFRCLYDIVSPIVVHDMHPEYVSTFVAAEERSIQSGDAAKPSEYVSPSVATENSIVQCGNSVVTAVQHHFAHIASCMAENELTGPVTGFAWDGTGYGTDGTIWGGECILMQRGIFRRVGTIRAFKLPGADAAIRDPRRCGAGILYELYGHEWQTKRSTPDDGFTDNDRRILHEMLSKNINAPTTTSMGRLFDAVSTFCGLHTRNSFEGQAAMTLEHLASTSNTSDVYPIVVDDDQGFLTWNWIPMFESIVTDMQNGRPNSDVAKMFHTTLAHVILHMAVARSMPNVVLSGGCFQNRMLLEHALTLLQDNGFTPYWHRKIPTNDGGIALGQMYCVLLAHHAAQQS